MRQIETSASHRRVYVCCKSYEAFEIQIEMRHLQKYFFLIVTCVFESSSAVQINYIKVPNAVKNDSGSAVVLDCNYSVRPDDTDLVVKWLLNGEVVYQWIPPQKPQSLGVLKNRVDLSHRASDDPKSVYRALKIWNPTTDIAGEYRCFVSTFADEDFSLKNMIVFEPEHSLLILKNEDTRRTNVNFTCFANEVYPAPKLVLYTDKSHDIYHKNPLTTLEWNTSKHPNGRFSIFVVANALIENLEKDSLIHCELRIPGTGYVKKRSLLYYPTGSLSGTSLNSSKLKFSFASLVVIIIFQV